ncbi:Hypothetical predicted protein, partial [Pelobates cultripes]
DIIIIPYRGSPWECPPAQQTAVGRPCGGVSTRLNSTAATLGRDLEDSTDLPKR